MHTLTVILTRIYNTFPLWFHFGFLWLIGYYFPCRNYVVQYVFEIHVPWATTEILDQLEGNYVDLSIQKYSSNVVEKCLKYAGEERVFSIIQELINSSRIDQIMQDPYGNYVVQAALNLSKVSVIL